MAPITHFTSLSYFYCVIPLFYYTYSYITFLPHPFSLLPVNHWARFDYRVLWLAEQCVQRTTQITYRVGWKRWSKFCTLGEIDPFLRRIPRAWCDTPRIFSFAEACLANFMIYLFFDQFLTASTISNYVSGVRHHFSCRNLVIAFFESSAISNARAALRILCRGRLAVRETGSLPVTLDFIESYTVWYSLLAYKHLAIYTAMRLAFLLMLRISEYVITKANHYLRSDDVMFIVSGAVVFSHEVTSEDWESISGVIIDVRSAKNDSDGAGHRFPFNRQPSQQDCICHLLFQWSVTARLKPADQFFSYQSSWNLSDRDMSAALKSLAHRHGLDPTRVSPHSLRYGGASALAAANVPTYLIQKLGRWKSLAFLRYIQLSESLLNHAQQVLTQRDLLTIADVRRLHPGMLFHKSRSAK
jgi:integrase